MATNRSQPSPQRSAEHPDTPGLCEAWTREMSFARDARARGDVARTWTHLERAHILSRRYPVGNTGGADVSAFAAMPIPDDLRHLLEAAHPCVDRANLYP